MRNNSENWSWKLLQLEPNYKHYLREKKRRKRKIKKKRKGRAKSSENLFKIILSSLE